MEYPGAATGLHQFDGDVGSIRYRHIQSAIYQNIREALPVERGIKIAPGCHDGGRIGATLHRNMIYNVFTDALSQPGLFQALNERIKTTVFSPRGKEDSESRAGCRVRILIG